MTNKFTRYLRQKFRGGYRPRTQSNSLQALFTFSRRITFISSFAGRPRIFSSPQTGYWAWPFLMQAVHMRLDIGFGPLKCSLNTGYQLAPTVTYMLSYLIQPRLLTSNFYYIIYNIYIIKKIANSQGIAMSLAAHLTEQSLSTILGPCLSTDS